MANPLEAFRKYQAVMLAVFGVLIVVVFTVGDPLMQMMGGGSGPQIKDPVVVNWVGGDVNRSDMQTMMQRRAMTARILLDLQSEGYRRANVGQLLRHPMVQQQRIVTERDLNEMATVRHMTLLRKAEELGIDYSDDAINAYLDRLVTPLTGGPQLVRTADMRQIIEGMAGRRRTTVSNFFNMIRPELIAREVESRYFERGRGNIPPAELLSYYTKVEKRISAEVIAIPVDAFLEQVDAPNDRDFEKYYGQYRSDLPSYDFVGGAYLISAKPGFKQPYKAGIEFIRFSHADAVDRAREEIEKDEEQIKAFYDRHKDTDLNLQTQDDVIVKPTEMEGQDAEGGAADGEEPAEDGDSASDDSAADAEEADAENQDGEAAEATEEKEVKYLPLDEARDYIVTSLARQRAASLIDETLDPLKEKMDDYFQYGRSRSLESLTAGSGLEVHALDPLSLEEYRSNTEIGQVPGVLNRLFGDRGEASIRKPNKLSDLDNNNYLFWKNVEVDENEVDLKDVLADAGLKNQVADAWKRGSGLPDVSTKAQGLASAAADKMAEAVRGGASMKDVAAGQAGSTFLTVGPFSWFEAPTAADPTGAGAVTLAEIEGLDAPGKDFMKMASSLEAGGVGVAMNHPRTMVYVIRVTGVTPTAEKLREDFLSRFKAETLPNGIRAVADYEFLDVQNAWYKELDSEYQVKWQPAAE